MLNEILFCPLDIEIENIEFDSFIGTPVVSKYNPYWNSTLLSDEVIKKNNFVMKLLFVFKKPMKNRRQTLRCL